jgi:hypothetical protein
MASLLFNMPTILVCLGKRGSYDIGLSVVKQGKYWAN